jgi:hypothetical protein
MGHRALRAGLQGLALIAVVLGDGFGQEGVSTDEKNWNRRPAGAGDYGIVTEVSGRFELSRFRSPVGGDLKAICEERREAVSVSIPAMEAYLAPLLAAPADKRRTSDLVRAHHDLGQLWAYQGRMEKAIPELEAALGALLGSDRDRASPKAEAHLRTVLGVLQLRRGELENCVHDKNASRCIFPIAGEGEHSLTSGSEAALEQFRKNLEADADDLESRWLLNVAAMTLGRYPAGLAKGQVIPPEAFASAEDPGRFVDVAHRYGLDVSGRAGGVVVDDIDGDGLFDVVISSVDPCVSLRYFHNEGNGTFRERTEEAGLSGQLGGINIVQTDYNNDGRLDLYVMRGGWELPMPNSLLRQNPDGTFTDVTAAAGLEKGLHSTHSAAWADYDNDGWLDLFVGHEQSRSALFHNQGDGTFVEVGEKAGVDRTAFTKGVAWGDYDNDGRPDLYVSNFGSPNFLYHNEGNGTFKEVARERGVDKPIMSFPTWFWDYDNDGWEDLFVASFVPSVTEVARGFLGLPPHAETMRLYHNDGHGGFEDVTAAVGLDRVIPTMGANFGDIDNDGFLDLYLGTGAPSYAALIPNFMFRNHDGRRFVDVTTATGTGHLQKGHGVAFADIDNDGDQDVFANIGGFVPGDEYGKVLFENPGHGNDWLRLRLVGVRTNRAAIGARIKLVAEDRGGASREIHRTVSSGGSFGSSPLTQQVGLGRAKVVRRLEVFWPTSGVRQVFRDVAPNQSLEIREGADKPLPLPMHPVAARNR